jgi:type VI secretion system protein ImpF
MPPNSSSDLPVTLSILDRLTDFEPRDSQEPRPTRAQSVRRLKEGLCRDLEWLLNSRRIAEAVEDKFKELPNSVFWYGLPDFSSYSLASQKDQSRLLRVLQSAVKAFEPRLVNVRISSIEAATYGSRTLRFRIEGLLMMDPAPEHVSFDTALELTSGEYKVKRDGNAG